MRNFFTGFLTLSLVIVSFALVATAAQESLVQEEAAQEEAADKVKVQEQAIDWKEDKVCRMVFFAVLEGLFRDGVADDVVTSIIGPKSDTADPEAMKIRMRRSFVMNCPLCQPTFEAFLAYQSRPSFNDGSGANTFGSGLEEELRTKLVSDDTMTRLMALREPVRGWILKKLESENLSETEFAEWSQRISERFQEGRNQLSNLLQVDEDYKNWSTYWGCAACNASQDASAELGSKIKKD